MKYLLLFALCLLPTVTLSQSYDLMSPGGYIYTWETNDNGAVLKTKYPVPICGGPSGAQYSCRAAIVTVYVGKNCDAFSPEWGNGTWEWSNAGWGIDLERRRIRFPRNESIISGNACGA